MITQNITQPGNLKLLDQEGAEGVAIQALTHMAQDTEIITDFYAISGIQPDEMRTAASTPGFFAGVLDFICAREDRLIAFTVDSGLTPEIVDSARKTLAGPPPEWNG